MDRHGLLTQWTRASQEMAIALRVPVLRVADEYKPKRQKSHLVEVEGNGEVSPPRELSDSEVAHDNANLPYDYTDAPDFGSSNNYGEIVEPRRGEVDNERDIDGSKEISDTEEHGSSVDASEGEENDGDGESDDQEFCEACGSTSTKDKGIMLLCDECNCGYHISCLNIPLPDMEKEWFCPFCALAMEQDRAAREHNLRLQDQHDATTEMQRVLQETYPNSPDFDEIDGFGSGTQALSEFNDEDALSSIQKASIPFSQDEVADDAAVNACRFGVFARSDDSFDCDFFLRMTVGVAEKVRNHIYCWTMANCVRMVAGGHIGRSLEVTFSAQVGIAILRQLGRFIPEFEDDNARIAFLKKVGLRLPVQDSMRFLRRHFPLCVDVVEVNASVDGKCFKAEFKSFSVLHCALHLYCAILNGTLGPFHAFDEVDCSASRQSGSRHAEFSKKIKATYPDIGANDLVLLLCMYSDKTVTTLTSLHPLFVWLEGLDQDTRAANLLRSHYLMGLLPSLKTMSYLDEKSGRFLPITSMKDESLIHRAARELRNECIRLVVLQLQATEAGVMVRIDGKQRRVRLFLSSYVCDMEEAREILCLRLGAARWPCISCYDYTHGESMPPPEECLGIRCLDVDELLRRDVRAANGPAVAGGRAKAKKELLRCYGIQIRDQCPFTRSISRPDGSQCELFLLGRSPSRLRSVDLLHNLDGALRRIFERVQDRLGIRALVNATKPFGNRSFGVVKTFTFHVMEHLLRDFGALILGVVHGTFKKVEEHERVRIITMLCLFQELIFILKDDAVGFLKNRLARVVKKFEKYFREQFSEDDVTPKIHEIFCHVVANVQEMGCCRNFSAAIGERLHDFVKDGFHDSSLRETDSGEYILLSFFYRVLFIDAERTNERRALPATWTPRVEIRLCSPNEIRSGDLAQFIAQVEENFIAVKERFNIGGTFDVRNAAVQYKRVVAFSSSIQGMIRWTESGGVKKRPLCINARSSAGVEDSWALAFKATNAIDYELLADLDGGNVTCSCQHHNPAIQWGCSFARNRNTAHALPVLFVELENGNVGAIVLNLKATKLKLRCMSAIFARYEYVMELDLVLCGRFRGKSRCYPLEGGQDCYVSRALSTTVNTL